MKTSENLNLSHEIIRPNDGKDIYFHIVTDTSSYVASHWHNALEFIYILSGELEMTIADKVQLLKEGDYTIINSKVIHATKCLHGNQSILVQIPYPFIKRYIPNLDSLIFILDCHTRNELEKYMHLQLKEVINRMRILHEAYSTSANLQFHSLIFEFLYLLHQNFSKEVSHMDYNQRTKNLLKLEPIIQYTEMYYTKSITIEEIANIASLQPAYFCRFFKKSMGTTYLQYLNEIRLSHIYRDLLLTDIPLVHLLEIHGFSNYKLFRRMFQEHFQDTPNNIRKKN